MSAKMQDEIDTYKALVTNAIQSHWNYPDEVDNSLSCRLRIKVAPGGAVLSVALVESSGNTALDRSAEVAVYKASPLPVPTEPELFEKFRELNLRVKPQGKV
jgi:colicin import membrane protein